MALIVFMPFHWASDMNPTFALARKLRNRGHEVHYLGIADAAERIRSQASLSLLYSIAPFPRVRWRSSMRARRRASYTVCLNSWRDFEGRASTCARVN